MPVQRGILTLNPEVMDAADARTFTEPCLVTPAQPITAPTLLHAALDDPGLPAIGDQFNATTHTDWYCVARRALRAIENSTRDAVVTLEWRDLSWQMFRFTGNTVRDQTRFDYTGDRNIVYYCGDAGPSWVHASGASDYTDVNIAQVQVIRPHAVLEFERYEFDDEWDMANRDVVGCVNADEWMGCQPRTWMCVNIVGEMLDRFGRCEIRRRRYTFEYVGFQQGSIMNTYDHLAWYSRRDTGRPPADVDPVAGGFPNNSEGNGWKIVRPQPAYLFAILEIPELFTFTEA